MEVDLTRGSKMIYVIPEVMMTIGDFYRNIQISILVRGYEAWQNSEANLLITRGMVVRLSNTSNVGFAYDMQGVVDYLTSHGVNVLPGRRLSTRNLQGLNWVINATQVSIPMQSSEVNSQTMMDGHISLSFSNYVSARPTEQPIFNNKDEEIQEILAVLIEIKPGVFTNYDGAVEEYYELYGDMDDYIEKGKQIIEQDDEDRYSSKTEPHILINKISPHALTPTRHTEGSAGLDMPASHAAAIEPYGRDLIHTGLRIEIPHGYYGRLASRSGLTWKTGVEVGAGVIDSDYRGEVQKFMKYLILAIQKEEIKDLGQLKMHSPKVKPPSQQPHYFTTQDIFSLLMPKETATVLVQEDPVQNDFEKDHTVDTSPGASVPRSMDPARNYEGIDDFYLDYIQYLSQLSIESKPLWDDYPESDSEWINLFGSEGGEENLEEEDEEAAHMLIEEVAASNSSPWGRGNWYLFVKVIRSTVIVDRKEAFWAVYSCPFHCCPFALLAFKITSLLLSANRLENNKPTPGNQISDCSPVQPRTELRGGVMALTAMIHDHLSEEKTRQSLHQ
ncbi:hypothetical protein ZIOFF_035474 [Zingiber officinale]|uniref:dUTP diphosphatase n=1 Tax=Zingiber officinale TaxID=94328 RepID=A0A8J5G9A1_ZINOF|nr:hypothetical protein ZIOFF_035474 [Zingiber officinale]